MRDGRVVAVLYQEGGEVRHSPFIEHALPPPGSALHRHEGYTHEGRCHIHPVNLYVRPRPCRPCWCYDG